MANWLIGREIVEEEQRGKKRADYGRELLRQLSGRLHKEFGAGFSVDSLERFRGFFLQYPGLLTGEKSAALRRISSGSISAAPRRISDGAQELHSSRAKLDSGKSHALRDQSEWWQPGMLHANLSLMHYRTLLRVDRGDTRVLKTVTSVFQAAVRPIKEGRFPNRPQRRFVNRRSLGRTDRVVPDLNVTVHWSV